jgi:CheY-like chemotaxis protein
MAIDLLGEWRRELDFDLDASASLGREPLISNREVPSAGEPPAAAGAFMGGAEVQDGLENRGRQILLVEDEAFVRRVTAEVLESAGYRLLVAENAAEAIKSCGQGAVPLHLLLSDVVLPGKNGRELARECRTLYPYIRVLLVSGYAEQLGISEAEEEGHEYLAKPFSTHTLLRKVRQMLEGTGAIRGNAGVT